MADQTTDPFSPDNVGKVQLIVLMRIYDVLMAIYNDTDKDAAGRLHDLHAAGGILGSLPYFDPERLPD
jgi:hypothetical protein